MREKSSIGCMIPHFSRPRDEVMNQYKQLSYEQRCHIFILKKSHLSEREIARKIGVNQSTVHREIRRNSGGIGYLQGQAQRKSEERRLTARKKVKMVKRLIKLIEDKLRLKWSPEQIAGWLKEETKYSISHETIYQHVRADKSADGDLYTYLRRKGRKYFKRFNGKRSNGQLKDRVSIDLRPQIVDRKSRVGDWEIDTIVGVGHRGGIVTIVERKTKFTLAAQVNSLKSQEVIEATIKLLNPYKKVVMTITADNGSEFAQHKKLTKALKAKVYFCHPYRSCERGLNENTNGLLRQYWPKKTELKNVEQKEVTKVIKALNRRPRKTLKYKTPEYLMNKHIKKLAA